MGKYYGMIDIDFTKKFQADRYDPSHEKYIRTTNTLCGHGCDYDSIAEDFLKKHAGVTYYTLYPEIKPSLDYYNDEMATWKPLQEKYYKSPK